MVAVLLLILSIPTQPGWDSAERSEPSLNHEPYIRELDWPEREVEREEEEEIRCSQ